MKPMICRPAACFGFLTALILLVWMVADLRCEPGISPKELASRKAAIEGMSNLDPALKKEVLTNIDQAMGFLELQTLSKKKADALTRQIESAPERLRQVEKELARPIKRPGPVHPEAGIETLEQRRLENEAALAVSRARLKDLNDRLAAEQAMIARAPEALSAASGRLEEIENSSRSGTSPETDLLAYSRVLALNAEHRHIKTEIALFEQRQRGHSLITALLRKERDLAEKTLAHHEQISKALSSAIQGRRSEDALKTREDAQNAILDVTLQPGKVQAEYDRNIQLSVELQAVANEEAALTNRLEAYQAHLKSIEAEFQTAKRRVELDVLTDVIGMALRSQRLNLPSPDRYDPDSKTYLARMSEISERHFELDRMARDLPAPDQLILSLELPDTAEARRLKPRIKTLLDTRQEMIGKLRAAYERVIRVIQEIEFTKKQVIQTSREFGELLDRHLLWIRSSKPFSMEEASKLMPLARELSGATFWARQAGRLMTAVRHSPVHWLAGFAAGLVLLFAAARGKKALLRIADDIDRQTGDSILLTLQAFGLTLLISLAWPYLFIFPAIQVSMDLNRQMMGNLPGPLSYCWIPVFWIFFFNLCRPQGLAQVHFRWPEAVRRIFRRHLSWLIPVEVLISLVYFLMATNGEHLYAGLMGTLAISVQCLALSFFGASVFRFKQGVTAVLQDLYPDTWFCRLRYLWYPSMVLIPLYILWLALSGYYSSAVELRLLLYETILLFFCLAVLNSLILRLLMLARRAIALKKAMENRTTGPTDKKEASRSPFMESILKLSAIDEQTRSLLKLAILILGIGGLWAIWAPVLPALGILQEIELWRYTTVSNGIETLVPITLANIALAFFIAIIMFIAVRNLPGLIEVILLNRLTMDAGARYAYITVSRYAIVALGIFIVLGSIGIKWSNMQWLVAALSVGLGFGLQEIVANFISGLIVLLERPFSLGDTVTIGEVTGTVTRIQIRATTIEDWDRKELIVPNKEFITGRLINWSLSDRIIRIKLPVGLAYGSDTDLAEKLMMKAAKNNDYVIASPKPNVVFLRFGDNALEYEVRVFIKDIDDWIPMLHSMNQTINKAFEAHGITIAFPQRDVHLDAASPVPVQVISDPQS